MQTQQLPLSLPLRDEAIFENYFAGRNTQVIAHLTSFISNKAEPFIFCYGDEGSGRTHLLQACCHAVEKKIFYLPLAQHADFSPTILESLETQDYVCLDDVNAVMGNLAWEESLFHFYNRAREEGVSLLMSGNCPPQQLSCALPDLQSRLCTALVLRIETLTDDEKIQALQCRATARGLVLSEEVASYFIHHHSRKMSDLMMLLEKCDTFSLITKRKITIPFVKMVLEK
jgi:DnaA family protein